MHLTKQSASAEVAELADALRSGRSAARRVGSTPTFGTQQDGQLTVLFHFCPLFIVNMLRKVSVQLNAPTEK
jgi:hypothetical protein